MTENETLILKWVNFMFSLDYEKFEDLPEWVLLRAKAYNENTMKNALVYNGVLNRKPTGLLVRTLKVTKMRVKRVRDLQK